MLVKCQTPSKAEDTRGRKPALVFDLKNRRRFSTPKTDMAKKVTTMLLLLQLCINIVAKRNKNNKKYN